MSELQKLSCQILPYWAQKLLNIASGSRHKLQTPSYLLEVHYYISKAITLAARSVVDCITSRRAMIQCDELHDRVIYRGKIGWVSV